MDLYATEKLAAQGRSALPEPAVGRGGLEPEAQEQLPVSVGHTVTLVALHHVGPRCG